MVELTGRKTARVLVPVAVAAVVATGVGLVPALASDSTPKLPSITAQELVAKVLASDADAFSGTVKVKADLGVPSQVLDAAAGGRSSAADPQSKAVELLDGEHTIQVAVDGPEKQRLGLVDNLAGYEVVHNGTQLWAWDSRSNQAVHLTAPQHGSDAPKESLPMPTPQEAAKQFLTRSQSTTSVTVAGTASVAGRSAYVLSVKPTQQGSTIAEVRISVDAEHGLPLAVQVRGVDGSQVLDAHYSSISFAHPAAKTFDFTVPKGAKVTEPQAEGKDEQQKPQSNGKSEVIGTGWTAVFSTSLPQGGPAPAAPKQDGQAPAAPNKHGGGLPKDPQALVKSLGKPVGGGTLISTKVLNVLITDDGRVYAGAVTLPVLQSSAGAK